MRTLLALLAVTLLLSNSATGQGPNTRDRLDLAHTKLFEKLQERDAVKATEWAERLKRSELLELLRVGPLADIASLEQVHQAYSADVPELKQGDFKQVRELLMAHIDKLRATREEVEQLVGVLPEYHPIDQGKVFQQRKEALDAAIQRVQRYMDASGAENSRRWQEFFEWDKLVRGVESLHAVTRLNRQVGEVYLELREVSKNFYGFTEGLGSQPFVDLREALDAYLDTYEFLKSPARTLPPEVNRRMQRLRAALIGYEYDYDPTARAAVGRSLEWLSQNGQGAELVDKLQQRYWHPNALVKISENFAGAGINDFIDDTSPVCERLMGTDISGTAHTTGKYFLQLAPADKGVALKISVEAQARSRTVGRRGKVRVHSIGNTTIQAGKPLFFSEEGILTSTGPAFAHCDTNTQITGVSHRCNLVRRIASRKAQEYKPVGERYADQKGEQQAIDELEKQVDPIIKQANDSYAKKVRQPLVGLEVFPRWFNIASTYDALWGKFVVALDSQLAAPNDPPALPEGRFAATIRVHESALTNVADNLIRGYTLNNENTIELLKELEREIPEELASGEEWSMKFAESNSVVVRFNDEKIQLGFRGEAFSQGENSDVRDVQIEFLATYRASIEPRGLVLRRIGDVEGNVIEDRATLADVTIMSVIVKKFNAVFEPEIVVEPQKLPEPYDKAGAIRPAYFSCGNGWVVASINADNVE